MATAVVEERQLLKTLRWYDGFVIALANPGFLLGSLGYSVGDLGGWGAALLWGIAAIVAVFINTVYSELAAMFPDKSGGVALYAHEAWRKYTTLIGPVATFGYWIGWSVVLAINGIFIGQIIQGAWFPGEPYGGASNNPDVTGYFSTGTVKIGLPQLIAIGLILAVWLFNVFGVRVGVTFGYLAGILLMVPLFVMMMLPFINGSFDSANLDNTIKATDPAWGGLQLSLVWIWLMCWSAWGVDVCATFAPEYKDTARDTKRALRSSALFILFVNIMLPIGFVGGGTPELVGAFDYVGALNDIVGPTSDQLLRRRHLRQLHHLDEHGDRRRQSRALRHLEGRVDGQAARAAEQVARPRERDDARHGHQHPLRPLRRQHLRHPRGVQHRLRPREHLCHLGVHPAAQGPPELAAADQALRVLGARLPTSSPLVHRLRGRRRRLVPGRGGRVYGETKEKIIGVGVLVIGILLFLFRRIVQDKETPHWREETPTMPDEHVGEASRAGDESGLTSRGSVCERGGCCRPSPCRQNPR